MFKHELIELLQSIDVPDDVHVYVAIDEEGSGFNRLVDWSYWEDGVEDINGPMIVLWP